MGQLRQRITALEQQYGAGVAGLTPAEARTYRALSRAARVFTAQYWAYTFAERQYRQETGRDDWYALPKEARYRRTLAHWARLCELEAALGAEAGLDEWLSEAEQAGWPPRTRDRPPMDRAAFEREVIEQRARDDRDRGGTGAVAVRWRRDHPDWRPDLSPAEADAFDEALIAETSK